MKDHRFYGAETYYENGDTGSRRLYTVYEENNRGQVSDLNADGEPIITLDDLDDFIWALYMDQVYDAETRVKLLEQAEDLRG